MAEKEFQWNGYRIFVSDKHPKKYYALIPSAVNANATVRTRKVYFGDVRYEHYKDKLGHYKDLDHNSTKRREMYKKRMEKNRHAVGTAGWFADQLLW